MKIKLIKLINEYIKRHNITKNDFDITNILDDLSCSGQLDIPSKFISDPDGNVTDEEAENYYNHLITKYNLEDKSLYKFVK